MRTRSCVGRAVGTFTLVVLLLLGGCAAINLADLAPAVAEKKGSCDSPANEQKELESVNQLSIAAFVSNSVSLTKSVSEVQAGLPPAMQNDPVVQAFLDLARNSVVQGFKEAGVDSAELTYVPQAGSISVSDLRKFAKNVLMEEMKPSVSAPSSRVASTPSQFVQYFQAYYDNKYIDRYGNSISKPTLTLTVSDTEISAAVSVLVDYIIDSIDTTPVWGTTANGVTTYYPGGTNNEGSKNEPTFLTVYGSHAPQYQPLSNGPCGITVAKAKLLAELAGAASDEGGTVSGLVHGSFGGFEVGLGFLGKFSFGDDQTLAAIVKAAASRLSARVTVAAAWPVLSEISYTDTTPFEIVAK